MIRVIARIRPSDQHHAETPLGPTCLTMARYVKSKRNPLLLITWSMIDRTCPIQRPAIHGPNEQEHCTP